ncbi:MAG: hypothetical protein GKR95_25615 [Gammaproteobacteria bacterium]|nr:hypothetical protein [Gammaproteobacteria bacterium]NKB65335.1 hypothetical protein [Gammaproteobacteria bacterium]
MQTWIYKGNRKANTYLYVTRKDDFKLVPDALLNLIGETQLVVSVNLATKTRLAQANIDDVVEQLKRDGYFLQLPPGDQKVEKLC